MSPGATLVSTWSAIYAFAAAYYAALWARTRRREPEHLSYACVCVGMAVWSAGAAMLRDAAGVTEGTLAVRVQYAGGLAAIAFFVDFTSHLVGRPRRRWVLATYVFCALAIALDVAGMLFDPSHTLSESALGRGSPYGAVEPAFRPGGLVVLAVALALAAVAQASLLRAARTDPDARVIALGTTAGLLAATHDLVIRALGLGSVLLTEHAGLAPVATVGFVLLRRFVRTAVELERRTEELGRSYDELRLTQEELVRKEQLAAVGELSAVIAHEVRNPLAILKNAVSSLRRSTLTSGDRSVLLGILDEETDRLNRLVRDLLAYARPVAPKGVAVAIEGLVMRAWEMARSGRDGADEVALVIELGEGPRAVLGDPELLRHALVNVIDNALQAMPVGGTLTVRGAPERIEGRPACALSFRDTGEGMDTLVRAKALDPFFTTRPAGTGLGLAIVDRVVKNHGGRLDIASVAGEGTTVTLTLPAAEGS